MHPDEPCPICGARLHMANASSTSLHCQECGDSFAIPAVQDGSAYQDAQLAREALNAEREKAKTPQR